MGSPPPILWMSPMLAGGGCLGVVLEGLVDVRRKAARAMRSALTEIDKYSVKMTFAPTQEAAERQLREYREPRPAGEDE